MLAYDEKNNSFLIRRITPSNSGTYRTLWDGKGARKMQHEDGIANGGGQECPLKWRSSGDLTANRGDGGVAGKMG